MLRDLLKRCASIKTVRLCLQLGRELSQPWAGKLDPSSIAQEQQPAVGVPFRRRAPGSEAMNQVYLDSAWLLTRVAARIAARTRS